MSPRSLFAAHALCTLLVACSSPSPEAAPPPLPSPPAAPAPSAPSAENTAPAPSGAAPDKAEKPARADDDDKPTGAPVKDKDRGLSLYELAKRGEAQLPATKPSAATPAPAKVEPKPTPTPAPVKPAPAAQKPATPQQAVVVPSTPRVRVSVPSALQANLDKDPRMQPWLNKAIGVIDGCFAKQPAGTKGTIEVTITMHENERPDADVRSLPPALSGMVACATGSLMRTKMPLFTGPEGQRSNLKILFGE